MRGGVEVKGPQLTVIGCLRQTLLRLEGAPHPTTHPTPPRPNPIQCNTLAGLLLLHAPTPAPTHTF